MLNKTNSPQETRYIAGRFAKKIIKKEGKKALVITLKGDLGSGKTVFVKGFLKSLGVKKSVQSPTFVLVKRYHIPKTEKSAFHIDLYRMKSKKELAPLRFGDILKDKNGIVLIEWPELLEKTMPKKRIEINFFHGKRKNERIISFQ